MIPNEAFLKYFPDAVLAGMKIYSDASVSDFFKSITKDKSTGFLNEWNAKRNRRERIYISYDSTNKNCQAGEIELAEFGHAKTDIGLAIINYSVGYDLKNKEPLFYEAYPGSINDVSQLRAMLGKITWYGYKKIGFIRLYLKVMKKRDTFIFITVSQKMLMNGKYHYAGTLLLLHPKG